MPLLHPENSGPEAPLTKKRKKAITDSIAQSVAQDMRPVNTVQRDKFSKMISMLGYAVPK